VGGEEKGKQTGGEARVDPGSVGEKAKKVKKENVVERGNRIHGGSQKNQWNDPAGKWSTGQGEGVGKNNWGPKNRSNGT